MTDTQKRGRGRPRQFSEQEALDAAMMLFWAKGYGEVGTAELCEKLGINPPSLYAAFGKKSELFEKVLHRYVKNMDGIFSQAFSDAKSLDAFIMQFLKAAVAIYHRHPAVRGCLMFENARSTRDEDVKAATDSSRDTLVLNLRSKLANLGVKNVDVVTDAVLVSLIGLSGASRDGMSQHQLEKVCLVYHSGIMAISK